MTRNRWLALGVLAIVAVTAGVLGRRGPARIAVDVARATRQGRFVSTVTASGEIVATRYADIGSSVMGKIVAPIGSSTSWRLPSGASHRRARSSGAPLTCCPRPPSNRRSTGS